MKRLVLAAAVAAAVPLLPTHAAPLCTGPVDVNCWNGTYYCRIYVAPRTCTHTA